MNKLYVQKVFFRSVQHVRKMMKGYIRQKYKVNISQRRISTALQMAAPQYHQRRQTNTARLANPIPHKPDYFGLQLHID